MNCEPMSPTWTGCGDIWNRFETALAAATGIQSGYGSRVTNATCAASHVPCRLDTRSRTLLNRKPASCRPAELEMLAQSYTEADVGQIPQAPGEYSTSADAQRVRSRLAVCGKHLLGGAVAAVDGPGDGAAQVGMGMLAREEQCLQDRFRQTGYLLHRADGDVAVSASREGLASPVGEMMRLETSREIAVFQAEGASQRADRLRHDGLSVNRTEPFSGGSSGPTSQNGNLHGCRRPPRGE